MSVYKRLHEVPAAKLWLLLRTFVLLLLTKTALAALPARVVIGWKQRAVRAGGLDVAAEAARRREVRWAVLVVARYSPVRFVCFPQCLAASALLAGSGIGSRLHYGVRRGATTARLETHTWLEAGGEVVIGGEVAPQYSTLTVYG